MAFVVTRPGGRFEIRESLHTADGPRARSLAGFDVLTDEVLAKAARRARRPFDVEAVLASGRRAGAPARVSVAEGESELARERFVEASRRMAGTLQRPRRPKQAVDPGAALIDLLGFADAVARTQPARPHRPLEFPVLARIVAERRASARAG